MLFIKYETITRKQLWHIPGLPKRHLNDDKFLIYASFFPYYEFTKNIVGEKAELYNLFHLVRKLMNAPSIKKIQALTDTDVFVYNGLGMEPYVQEIIDSDEFNNIVFIKASKGIDLIKIDNTCTR